MVAPLADLPAVCIANWTEAAANAARSTAANSHAAGELSSLVGFGEAGK